MDYVKLELNASEHGWNCSGCGLFTNCIGKPIFKTEEWAIEFKTLSWLKNKPAYSFCPRCGKKIKKDDE